MFAPDDCTCSTLRRLVHVLLLRPDPSYMARWDENGSYSLFLQKCIVFIYLSNTYCNFYAFIFISLLFVFATNILKLVIGFFFPPKACKMFL